MSVHRTNRKVHYWGAIICAVPVLIVIVTGIILLLKGQMAWVQPPTMKGEVGAPSVEYAELLESVRGVPEAGISGWDDIDRLDVRPGKGVIKVRGKNMWEVQVDQVSGEVLSVEYRRSDLIESLHDGSWFHDGAKLWVFLPSAVVLLVLWLTGIYLFLRPFLVRRGRKKRKS